MAARSKNQAEAGREEAEGKQKVKQSAMKGGVGGILLAERVSGRDEMMGWGSAKRLVGVCREQSAPMKPSSDRSMRVCNEGGWRLGRWGEVGGGGWGGE